MHTAPSASSAPAAAEPPELFQVQACLTQAAPALQQQATASQLALQTIKAQSQARPDKGSALDISRALANSVNPGYVIRDGQDLKSQTKDSYAVDETEVCCSFLQAGQILCSAPHAFKPLWHSLPAHHHRLCSCLPSCCCKLTSAGHPAGVHACARPAGLGAPSEAQRHEQACGGPCSPAAGGQGCTRSGQAASSSHVRRAGRGARVCVSVSGGQGCTGGSQATHSSHVRRAGCGGVRV